MDGEESFVRRTCVGHPTVTARWRCPSCSRTYCNDCLVVERISGEICELCPECRDQCEKLPESPVRPGRGAGAWELLLGPLRGAGLVALLTGAVVVFGGFAAMWLGWVELRLVGVAITSPVWIIPTGFWWGYLMEIAAVSARGSAKGPVVPDFRNALDNLLYPLLALAASASLGFLPLVVFRLACTSSGGGADGLAFWLLFAVGTLWFTAAVGVASVFRSIGSLKPWFVVWAAWKMLPEHLLAALVLAASILLTVASVGYSSTLSEAVLRLTLIPPAVYLAMLGMHILGLAWWRNRARLGWLEKG